MVTDILLIVISIMIIVSKFFDCYTTSILITNPNQEKNPIARKLFKKFGSQKAIWGIFGLTILIVAISFWLLITLYNTNFYKVMYILVGLFVTFIQFAVAHTNKTRNLNFVTRILLKKYSKYE